MATVRRKRKTSSTSDRTHLRKSTAARTETRFEPKTTPGVMLSVVAMSLGAVAAGAGFYSRWLRAEELGPHPYATYMLLGGAVLMLIVALAGARPAKPIRVGDGGVGVEADGRVERHPWHELTAIERSGQGIRLRFSGTLLEVPQATHPVAVQRILHDAQARLPSRDLLDGAVGKAAGSGAAELGKSADDGGERLVMDPLQVAGMHCKNTDKLIAFEKDARVCDRCEQVYHRAGVPKRCLSCDARLR